MRRMASGGSKFPITGAIQAKKLGELTGNTVK